MRNLGLFFNSRKRHNIFGRYISFLTNAHTLDCFVWIRFRQASFLGAEILEAKNSIISQYSNPSQNVYR